MKADNVFAASRDELLSKLKSITFAAFITVLPTEMCLEISTMTDEGVGCRWIGYDDWQVFELRTCKPEEWHIITKKISEKTLTADDIVNTDLENLVNGIMSLHDNVPDLSTFLSDLCNHGSSFGECFYGFFNSGEMLFFSTREDLRKALRTTYAVVDSKWEDLDLADMEYWWDRYNDERHNLPLLSFDNE